MRVSSTLLMILHSDLLLPLQYVSERVFGADALKKFFATASLCLSVRLRSCQLMAAHGRSVCNRCALCALSVLPCHVLLTHRCSEMLCIAGIERDAADHRHALPTCVSDASLH